MIYDQFEENHGRKYLIVNRDEKSEKIQSLIEGEKKRKKNEDGQAARSAKIKVGPEPLPVRRQIGNTPVWYSDVMGTTSTQAST